MKFLSTYSWAFSIDTESNDCHVGNFICGDDGGRFIFEMENLKYEEAFSFCEKKNYSLCR